MSLHGFFKTDIVTISPDSSVVAAATIMRDRHVGDIVVVEERGGQRTPIGFITDRDIAIGAVASHVERISQMRVCDLMTSHPVCARESDGIYAVIQLMRREGVGRLPVVNEQDELVGIVTSRDVLSLLTSELNEVVSIAEDHKEAGQPGSLLASRRASQPGLDQLTDTLSQQHLQ